MAQVSFAPIALLLGCLLGDASSAMPWDAIAPKPLFCDFFANAPLHMLPALVPQECAPNRQWFPGDLIR